ncbi:hypothetical protein ES702_07832 [subsurface metagenome]
MPKFNFGSLIEKKAISQEEISPEQKKIISKPIQKKESFDDLALTPSAKLNLLKYLYAQTTGKSTTNKIKKSMKKAVIEEISKF